jgi:hypothetical protein
MDGRIGAHGPNIPFYVLLMQSAFGAPPYW